MSVIQGGVGFTTMKGGQIVKQALSAANSTVAKGVYDATLLETVDADLAVGNIINTATIFGKVGTAVPGGTETIDRYSTGTLADGVSYTPAVAGIFFGSIDETQGTITKGQVFSTAQAAWYTEADTSHYRTFGISDGSNWRLKHENVAGDFNYALFRWNYSSATYERNRDSSLTGVGTTYTPAESGRWIVGLNDSSSMSFQIDINGTWMSLTNSNQVSAGYIGDGINFRVRCGVAGTVYYVLMRAKLT